MLPMILGFVIFGIAAGFETFLARILRPVYNLRINLHGYGCRPAYDTSSIQYRRHILRLPKSWWELEVEFMFSKHLLL